MKHSAPRLLENLSETSKARHCTPQTIHRTFGMADEEAIRPVITSGIRYRGC